MATDRIVWDGLTEFYDFLRTLPRDLGAEAGPIVTQAATLAEGDIRRRYGSGKTGKLARGLRMTANADPYGALAIVRNTAKHAALFEFGTAARHVNTIPPGRAANWGKTRGSLAPAKFFVPIAMTHRRAMYARLVALVERHGFTVG